MKLRLPALPNRKLMPLVISAVVLLAWVYSVGVVVIPSYQSKLLPSIVPPVIVIVLAEVPPPVSLP